MDVQPHLLNLSAYINQNLEKDLPLSSLAKRVGLSPFHFHRKFGAYFGESLHQHIKRLRLERAAFSLAHGTKPVREIARDSGYKTVSAFSHAFSGFAGQSPTRYRSHAPGENGTAAPVATPEPPAARPAWIGELPAQSFAFVRASGRGRGAQPEVCEAVDALRKSISPLPSAATRDQIHLQTDVMGAAASGEADRSAFTERGPLELIVATADLYGIAQSGSFRVDVGLDGDRVPSERSGAFGMQTLPAGRYARFDMHCAPSELVERSYAAYLHGLDHVPDAATPAACFVRFRDQLDGDAPRDFQLFVPLS